MPIYEYQCTACGHTLDSFQKVSEAPLTECPVCHKTTLQKQMSAPAFQLKGTGWYATDFRTKSKTETPAKESSDKTDKTDSTTKSETTATTKTEEKKTDTSGTKS